MKRLIRLRIPYQSGQWYVESSGGVEAPHPRRAWCLLSPRQLLSTANYPRVCKQLTNSVRISDADRWIMLSYLESADMKILSYTWLNLVEYCAPLLSIIYSVVLVRCNWTFNYRTLDQQGFKLWVQFNRYSFKTGSVVLLKLNLESRARKWDGLMFDCKIIKVMILNNNDLVKIF